MVKIAKAPSVNMLNILAQFLRETGKTGVRFNEFFVWLQDREIAKKKREEFKYIYKKGDK